MQVIGDAAFDSDQPLLIDTLGATLMRQPTLNSPRHELGDGPVAIHHCDIKPENIMILRDLAVVGDFGVARILRSGADSRATTMGGSVAYYELRTGKLPFPEESKAQVIHDKLAGHLKFGDVSSQEAEVLQRATSVQPGKRFPSARAFVKALRKAESITVRKPNVLWSFMGIVLTAFATLGAITSFAWHMKLDPFAAMIKTAPLPVAITRNENPEFFQSEKVASIDVVPVNTEMTETNREEPKVEPKLRLPTKPFRVSISGIGTHDSITKAIADSAPGETITILAGTYRESFVIDRSIKLVGEGAVKIISTDQACVKIQADSQVVIEKVTFDSQAANFNAIDIVGGSLVLTKCDVFASSKESYNCVKARANATFLAEKCKFQSAMDVAVSAWGLSIKQSKVELKRVTVEGVSDENRVAMQITENSEVKCTDCDFFGTACGILLNVSSIVVDDPKKTIMTRTPVVVNSDRMTLTDCDVGWIFNGIGSSRVKQLDGDSVDSHRVPKLMDEDLELKGADLTNFSVVKKAGR